MPRGGARPGAGRPKGGPGKKKGAIAKSTRAILEAAAAHSVTPLEVILENMRRHRDAGEHDAAEKSAALAAPYLHPKLAAATVTVRKPSEMTDAELAQWIADAKLAAGIAGSDRRSGNTTGDTKH
jgi:hypothetical protein